MWHRATDYYFDEVLGFRQARALGWEPEDPREWLLDAGDK